MNNKAVTCSDPLVSICIPMYNASEYLVETIRSIQRQSYKSIEIVVVDDYSSDNSYDIAKSFESEGVRVYKNLSKGGNAARNYAFAMSRGEYVKFLDADDFCSDNMVMSQVRRMLVDGGHNSVVFSPVKMSFLDNHVEAPSRSIDRDYTPGIELLLDMWRTQGWNCPHCYLMHRSLIERVGGWDETIIKNQDGEFFARILAASDRALAVKDEVAYWRQTRSGVSANRSIEAHRSFLHSYDIIIELLLRYNDTLEVREICAKEIGRFVFIYYPSISPLMGDVYSILGKLNQSLLLPSRMDLNILSHIIGWRRALKTLRWVKSTFHI